MAHLKAITGPMFSGKTEELIRILHRSQIAEKKILVIKPVTDTRSGSEIVSRKKVDLKKSDFQKFLDFPAVSVASAKEITDLMALHKPDVLAIDETQFFGDWIIEFIDTLLREQAQKNLLILAAGLDMDAWGRPFGPMPKLLAIADEVQKETAICFVCKARPAIFTQKLVDTGMTVEVGDAGLYEARCRVCHILPNKI